jgi:hypothetical protein
VYIREQGYFSGMSARELNRLQKRAIAHQHASNTIQRVTKKHLGNIQVSCSFGRAPCKFVVLEKDHAHDMKLVIPEDFDKLHRASCFLLCHLQNSTGHSMQLLKCVFAHHAGECINAVDVFVPAGQESVWTTGATRAVRGNSGCAIFSVGGVEVIFQWHWPKVGVRTVDSRIGPPHEFSGIARRGPCCHFPSPILFYMKILCRGRRWRCKLTIRPLSRHRGPAPHGAAQGGPGSADLAVRQHVVRGRPRYAPH